MTTEGPPDDWNWEQPTMVPISVADARFVLVCCWQWVPEGDVEIIASWIAANYEEAPILRLVKKVLPLLTIDTTTEEREIELSVGDISYILHFLRGDDSYSGGANFEKALLKALWELVKGE